MARWIRFFIAILIGAALGALYGWVIHPVEYIDTAPASLRMDYKTDYVLMVAEAYSLEKELSLAAERLSLLGDDSPGEIVRQALESAEPFYTESDLALMQTLSKDLQIWNPAVETATP